MSPLGARFRKPTEYVRHYTKDPRAVLESGDLILIEPYDNYGYYIVRTDTMPELLIEKTVNLATKWTGPLPPLSLTATSGPSTLVRSLDVFPMELAHYRIVCLDPGFQVLFAQPTAEFRFKDKAGAHPLSQGNSLYHVSHFGGNNYGPTPELWVFQDDTPIQMAINSTNMNEQQFNCRVQVLGFKYQLLRVQVPKPDDEPRTVVTIRVGPKQ